MRIRAGVLHRPRADRRRRPPARALRATGRASGTARDRTAAERIVYRRIARPGGTSSSCGAAAAGAADRRPRARLRRRRLVERAVGGLHLRARRQPRPLRARPPAPRPRAAAPAQRRHGGPGRPLAGRSLAVFVGTAGGDADVYRVPFRPDTTLAMGDAVDLTHRPGADLRPAISPDGRRIAFTSDHDTPPAAHPQFPFAVRRDGELYVMNADGGDLRRLTRSPGGTARPPGGPTGARSTSTPSAASPAASASGRSTSPRTRRAP